MGWARFTAFLLFSTAASQTAAMTDAGHGRCTIVGADKLPAEAGGADALCSAVRRAIAAKAPNADFTAELKVMTPSMVTAALVVNGRDLPEQKFAVMDRKLNRASLERFAQSIATTVAKAAKP